MVNRSRRNFGRVLRRDNRLCQYCGAVATSVDHVVPWSWRKDNSERNLVAACKACNSLAGSQVFASFEEKQHYLVTERERRMNRDPASRLQRHASLTQRGA